MKHLKNFLIIGTAILLSSCVGMNLTSYVNNDVNNTNVVLSQNNYRIIGKVRGEASAKYAFTIGGLKKKTLENNARADMYNKADLKDGQAIINVSTTHSFKMIFGPIYMQSIAVCTGTIIEFTDGKPRANTVKKEAVEPKPEPVKPFSDKNFRKVVSKFDTDKNGEISEKEALAVKTISCRAYGIKDLTGIEMFENLEVLIANDNHFESVDLSKNKKLKDVKVFSKTLKKVVLSQKPNKIDVSDKLIVFKK